MRQVLGCIVLAGILASDLTAEDSWRNREAKLKSVATARILQAIIPGLGKVYAGSPWYGLMDFAVVGISAYACATAVNRAGGFQPVTRDDRVTDVSAIFAAVMTAMYHGYHIWAVREDVMAYNYRVLFYDRPAFFLKLGKNNDLTMLQMGVCF